MKKNRLFIVAMAGLCVAVSCTKSIDNSAENKKAAEEFKTSVKNNRYRLVDFYSDKPVDYEQTDSEIRQETDLRAYIKPYLHDDLNIFDATGVLKVEQKTIKISGNDSAVICRNYALSTDKKFVYLDFIDYFYDASRYKLQEFSDSAFIIYIDWPTGAKLFSKFRKIN
jgi:hypothetical protein